MVCVKKIKPVKFVDLVSVYPVKPAPHYSVGCKIVLYKKIKERNVFFYKNSDLTSLLFINLFSTIAVNISGDGTSKSNSNSNGNLWNKKEITGYDPLLVQRAVHIIRNPFDNLVSNFHLE